MFKNNNKGLTLVEIIIALALIGIISVGIIPAFAMQFKMLVDTKSITIGAFEAQGQMENSIAETKKIIQSLVQADIDNLPYQDFPNLWGWGQTIRMFKISETFPSNEDKSIYVYLSGLLAQLDKQNLMAASDAKIGVKVGTSWVYISPENSVSATSTPAIQVSCQVTTDTAINAKWQTNIFAWYMSKPGNSDPQFPEDYELFERTINKVTEEALISTSNLANRYVVATVTPVDINGVHGSEAQSSNRILFIGPEWRSGVNAWFDVNDNSTFDFWPIDCEIAKKSGFLWKLIEKFDAYSSEIIDASDHKLLSNTNKGSLFVPMRVEPLNYLLTPDNISIGAITVDTTAYPNSMIDWTIEKNANISTNIEVLSNSLGRGINIKTKEGSINLWQFVYLDSLGHAVPDAYGKSIVINKGPQLKANNNDINLDSGIDKYKRGDIMLQNYAGLSGENINLSAKGHIYLLGDNIIQAGKSITFDSTPSSDELGSRNISIINSSISISGSAVSQIDMRSKNLLTMGNTNISGNGNSNVNISAIDGVTLSNVAFNGTDVNLYNDTAMLGGGWSSGSTISVANGKTLSVETGSNPVDNSGTLDLGNTGAISFKTSMEADIKNPLKIALSGSANTVKIQTSNYSRNIGYASANSAESVASAGIYQNLGSGLSNIEYTASRTASSITSLSSITYAFDGTDTITIGATAIGQVNATNIKLTLRDKYSDNAILGSIYFTVSADTSGHTTVMVVGSDTVKPVITVNGTNPISVEVGDTYIDAGATVTDNFDTGLTASASGTVNTSVLGTYVLTYNATDSSGNKADQKTRTVNVTSLVMPAGFLTFTVNGNVVTQVKSGTQVVITATFNKPLKDSPVVKIAGTSVNIFTAANMTKVDTTHYTYAWTVVSGDGTPIFAFSAGVDLKNNPITAAPTSGTIIVDNTSPSGILAFKVGTSTVTKVKKGDNVIITATFSEPLMDSPIVRIAGSGADSISATNMTKVDNTHYTYTWTVASAANSATETFTLSIGQDLASNLIISAPTPPSLAVDNKKPTATVTTTNTAIGSSVLTSKSDELGHVYLVSTTDAATVVDATGLDALVYSTKAAIADVTAVAPTNSPIQTTGLKVGTYKVYAVDEAGNMSGPSAGTITLKVPGPTASVGNGSISDGSTTQTAITFDKGISAATVTGYQYAVVTIAGNTVTIKNYTSATHTTSAIFANTTNISLTVTSTDTGVSITVVRRSVTDWSVVSNTSQ